MSLQIWLPLTQENDFKNKGLYKGTITNNGATYNESGKLGSSYKLSGKTLSLPNFNFTSNQFSAGCWVKFISFANQSNSYLISLNKSTAEDYKFIFGIWSSDDTTAVLRYNLSNNTSTLQLNTWYHLFFTYNNGTVILYINGVQVNSFNSTIKDNTAANLTIGGRSTNEEGTTFKGVGSPAYYNDIRIYDECLSAEKIREIALGKALHLPLNDIKAEGYTINKLNGNTVVWNQLVEFASIFKSGNGNSTFTTDGITSTITLNEDATSEYYNYFKLENQNKHTVGHIYYIAADVYCTKGPKYSFDGNRCFTSKTFNISDKTWTRIEHISTCASISSQWCLWPRMVTNGMVAGDYTKVRNVIEIDLTTMFGAGNEPSSVEEYNNLMNCLYSNESNAGSIMNYGTKQINWNQLVPQSFSVSDNTVDTITKNLNVYTYTYNNSSRSIARSSERPYKFTRYHKYYIKFNIKCDVNNRIYYWPGNATAYYSPCQAGQWYTSKNLITITQSGDSLYKFFSIGQASWDSASINSSFEFTQPIMIDLTQIFGPGNEPTSTAEFEMWLDENNITDFSYIEESKINYYTEPKWIGRYYNIIDKCEKGYWNRNTGIKGVDTTHICCADYIPVKPSTTYRVNRANYARFLVQLYDSNKHLINGYYESQNNNETIITTNNTAYITFFVIDSGTYQRNLSICEQNAYNEDRQFMFKQREIRFDQLIKQYFPYGMAGINSVRDSIEFTSTNYIITKKMSDPIHLGNLTWAKLSSNDSVDAWQATIPTTAADTTANNILSNGYAVQTSDSWLFDNTKMFRVKGTTVGLCFTKNTMTAATVKEAVKNIYLVAELATPVTQTVPSYYKTTCTPSVLENSYDYAKCANAPINIETSNKVINENIYDISGAAYNMITAGEYTLDDTSAIYKYAIKFNGHNSYIYGNNPLSGYIGDLTISYWFKPDANNASYNTTISNNNGNKNQCWLSVNSESRALWFYNDGFYIKSQLAELTNDTWHHIVLTQKSSDLTFQYYLNGYPIETDTVGTAVPIKFSTEICIGGRYCSDSATGSSKYDQYGSCSDVRFYSTKLTDEEIYKLYKGEL